MEIEIDGRPSLTLTKAVLVYTDHSGTAVATEHNLVGGKIMPGAALDLSALVKLIENPASSERLHEFKEVCPRVILESDNYRVWYRQHGYAVTYLNGKKRRIWCPGLIFCGHKTHRRLFVWAFQRDGQSQWMDTTMRHFTLGHHVNNHGNVCLGSANPRSMTPDDWEDAFFLSSKTTKEGFSKISYEISKLKEIGTLKDCLALVARQQI